jgi:hypothetical protein
MSADESGLRKRLCLLAKSLHDRGVKPGGSGSRGIRLEDGFSSIPATEALKETVRRCLLPPGKNLRSLAAQRVNHPRSRFS